MFSAQCIDTLLRLLPQPAVDPSVYPGITLIRSDSTTPCTAIIYQPVFYIVIQGQKMSLLAGETYRYDSGRFLASSVPLPMEGMVTRASAREPYLAIKLDVDSRVIMELLQELPELVPAQDASRGVCVCPVSKPLVEAVERLVASLADPQRRRVLTPMLVREILFYGLLSPQGAQLAAFVTRDRHHQRIARVIRHIQENFDQPLDVNALASVASMSQSGLHQHFKAVTNASPLQYIKAIRLHRAHQLVAGEHKSVSEAAWQVGYQSVSQFSREYKRLFGQPPSQARALSQ
ncbi:AraC family transcriptional regulator [Mangrovimicrobium sediminis]|uniref:AraC family transcriptional regulator n=1 Tax=Mangrovimicrobium sediminis TaxID=2562682 RepID=A0A4Z0M9Y8_9GAMM|nr:AraC family transcriptional regulator [Haliea sp. SAOS-164]TGD76216.1 AraC family transcriptional regulator [Haliea sp. SAOS-164]